MSVIVHEEVSAPIDVSIIRSIVTCVLEQQRRAGDVAVVFIGEERGRALNTTYRDKETTPNVLAFPPGTVSDVQEGTSALGDVMITVPVIEREAAKADIPVRDHTVRLLIHGVLHLLGYDHEQSDAAQRMEMCEKKLFEHCIGRIEV